MLFFYSDADPKHRKHNQHPYVTLNGTIECRWRAEDKIYAYTKAEEIGELAGEKRKGRHGSKRTQLEDTYKKNVNNERRQ